MNLCCAAVCCKILIISIEINFVKYSVSKRVHAHCMDVFQNGMVRMENHNHGN